MGSSCPPFPPVIGRFYKNGEWHIFRAPNFSNVNGDPLNISPSLAHLKQMHDLIWTIYDTVATDPTCLRIKKLQEVLYRPDTSIRFEKESVIIVGAGNQKWDISDIPAQKITVSASEKTIKTLRTFGIFTETLGSLVPKMLKEVNKEEDLPPKESLPQETTATPPPVYYAEPLPSTNDLSFFLPFLQSWCSEDELRNPDGQRAITVFEQKIQEDFLASPKEGQKSLPPTTFIKNEVAAIFNEVERSCLSSQQQEALAFLKENARLEKKIFQKWEEILHPPSLHPRGLRLWKHYSSSQNIAFAALVSGAFYCLPSTSATIALFAGFLTHRHVTEIDNRLRAILPINTLHPTFRKVTAIALAGIAASALCSWIAPTNLVTFLGIYYFGIERNPVISSFAEKIPHLHLYPKVATSLLILSATAFCSGFSPVVSLGAIATSIFAFTHKEVLLQPFKRFPSFMEIFNNLSSSTQKFSLSATSGLLTYISGKYLIPAFVEKALSDYSNLIFYALHFSLFPLLDKALVVITESSSYLLPASWWGKTLLLPLLLPCALICKQWIKENAARFSDRFPKWILPTSEKTSWLITTILWGMIFSLGRHTISLVTTNSSS